MQYSKLLSLSYLAAVAIATGMPHIIEDDFHMLKPREEITYSTTIEYVYVTITRTHPIADGAPYSTSTDVLITPSVPTPTYEVKETTSYSTSSTTKTSSPQYPEHTYAHNETETKTWITSAGTKLPYPTYGSGNGTAHTHTSTVPVPSTVAPESDSAAGRIVGSVGLGMAGLAAVVVGLW